VRSIFGERGNQIMGSDFGFATEKEIESEDATRENVQTPKSCGDFVRLTIWLTCAGASRRRSCDDPKYSESFAGELIIEFSDRGKKLRVIVRGGAFFELVLIPQFTFRILRICSSRSKWRISARMRREDGIDVIYVGQRKKLVCFSMKLRVEHDYSWDDF
jgi:hypothetical protein